MANDKSFVLCQIVKAFHGLLRANYRSLVICFFCSLLSFSVWFNFVEASGSYIEMERKRTTLSIDEKSFVKLEKLKTIVIIFLVFQAPYRFPRLNVDFLNLSAIK